MADPLHEGQPHGLALHLDRGSDVALFRQIADQVWEQVVDGTLRTGQRLPTVRQLAIDLGVHPNTVGQAYRELELLGVVTARSGEGTFVGLKPPDGAELERRRRLEAIGREAVAQAREAGFSVDELLDAVAELRSSEGNTGRTT